MDPPIKRPRGRPPKVKRGVRKSTAQPAPDSVQKRTPRESVHPLSSTSLRRGNNAVETYSGAHIEGSGSQFSHSLTPLPGDNIATPIGSKRSSPEGDHYTSPMKRICAGSSASNPSTVSGSVGGIPSNTLPSAVDRKGKAASFPARRSTRHATVHATQISEGTLRPPGPPCLEAALNIALRNLESETWRYLWAFKRKHTGGPLPTPAAVKEACPQVRKAAEFVDKADRELEDAIDEIIRASTQKQKRHRGRPPKQSKEQFTNAVPDQQEYSGMEIDDRRSSSLSELEDKGSSVETASFGSGSISEFHGHPQVSPAPRGRRSQPTRMAKAMP